MVILGHTKRLDFRYLLVILSQLEAKVAKTIELEYDKWLYVKGPETAAAAARAFFGAPANTPTTLDPALTLRNGMKTWKVLSPAWVAQRNEEKKK